LDQQTHLNNLNFEDFDMSRLTFPPNFIGTPGSDSLIGEQLNGSPAIGIDILTRGFIYTRSGNDTIKGKGAGISNSAQSINGTGIVNRGSLNTESGKDAIAGIGIGGIGGSTEDDGYDGNGGTGTGIANSSSLNTGQENDTITGTGTGGTSSGDTGISGAGIGIQNIKNATITTESGNHSDWQWQ
jgi:hypothetical protein